MARPATSLAAARGSTCPRVAPTLFCDAVSRSRVAGLARHRFLVRSTARSVAPDGPPASFQPRELTGGTSAAVVARRYPELADLVEEGVLHVVLRPSDYKERRTDGYQEPKEIFLVATAHLSKRSCEDVARVVDAVVPQSVVVELCKSRAAVMYDSGAGLPGSDRAKAGNQMGMSGDSFLGAVGRSARLGGQSAFLLRILLAQVSNRMSAQVAVQSGAEMRAARVAASRVQAQVVLGDRPIEITLRRAWASLSGRERLRLTSYLIRALLQPASAMSLDEDLVERLKEDDAVSLMLAQLASSYPGLLRPLVHERDLFLAWSLKRSKAVNGTERVVGVVGKGHLRGVVYALTADSTDLRLKDLVGGLNTAASKRKFVYDAVRRVAWELALGAALFGGATALWRHHHALL